jgi:gamma-glutamyl-gamma-aminobutyrate hydrolase PuuD
VNIVAVSQRVLNLPDRNETRDELDHRLSQWISKAGGLPFPVPNGLDQHALTAWLECLQPTAIVLSGGEDIGTFPMRDETERFLLAHAARQRLPVLGLCRGMQMMAVWLGGALKRIDGHIRTRHKLQGALQVDVNSFHGIGLADCPPDCDILARADDGEIEAIRHRSLPWEGWMWHPEREASFASWNLERAQTWLGSGVD